MDKPAAMARYSALEPTYCFELIGMLGAYRVPVDISGHGLRERGLGNCSSKTSWSLPQWGHFNVLSVTAVSEAQRRSSSAENTSVLDGCER